MVESADNTFQERIFLSKKLKKIGFWEGRKKNEIFDWKVRIAEKYIERFDSEDGEDNIQIYFKNITNFDVKRSRLSGEIASIELATNKDELIIEKMQNMEDIVKWIEDRLNKEGKQSIQRKPKYRFSLNSRDSILYFMTTVWVSCVYLFFASTANYGNLLHPYSKIFLAIIILLPFFIYLFAVRWFWFWRLGK